MNGRGDGDSRKAGHDLPFVYRQVAEERLEAFQGFRERHVDPVEACAGKFLMKLFFGIGKGELPCEPEIEGRGP